MPQNTNILSPLIYNLSMWMKIRKLTELFVNIIDLVFRNNELFSMQSKNQSKE